MSTLPKTVTSNHQHTVAEENCNCSIKLMVRKRFKSLDEEILRPYGHAISVPGKNIRINLIGALSNWLSDVPKETTKKIAEIIQLCHNGSLLIDDMQDDSILRRGVPTAHVVFGYANTINSSNFLVFGLNVGNVMELDNPKAVKAYFDCALDAIRGQGLKLYWRDHYICPTEEEYFNMIDKKTGAFFTLGKDLMKFFSNLNKNVDTILTAIGQYFQIVDDYNSLKNKFYFESKGIFCEDITEGKFGYPTVHAVNTNPEMGKVLIDTLKQRTHNKSIKRNYVSLLESCGSFEYTRKKLKDLTDIIHEEYAKLGENQEFKCLLEALPLYSL